MVRIMSSTRMPFSFSMAFRAWTSIFTCLPLRVPWILAVCFVHGFVECASREIEFILRGFREFNFYHCAGGISQFQDRDGEELFITFDEDDGGFLVIECADAGDAFLAIHIEADQAGTVAAPVPRLRERHVDAGGGHLEQVARTEAELTAGLGGVEKLTDLLADHLEEVEVGAGIRVEFDGHG